MPASPTLARPSPRVANRGSRFAGMLALLTTALAAVVLITDGLREVPRTHVTIDNPTDYAFHVAVRSTEGGPDLLLGMVAPGATREFGAVVDQGDRWAVDLFYGGTAAGTIEVDGSGRDGVVVTVPDRAATALSDARLEPPPG